MSDEKMDRMIEASRGYNEPPATPAEEMWAVIRAELPGRSDADGESDGVLDLEARRAARQAGARKWTPWAIGLAAAAMLVVGFGLGRMTQPPTPSTGLPLASNAAAEPAGRSPAVRLVAAEHLGDAEALLTMFRSASGEDRQATADWARDLLSTTRLLLDSRMAEDPELAMLLNELELVLVQIANVPADGDQELIEEGIRDQQLLTKLRIAQAPADISL